MSVFGEGVQRIRKPLIALRRDTTRNVISLNINESPSNSWGMIPDQGFLLN